MFLSLMALAFVCFACTWQGRPFLTRDHKLACLAWFDVAFPSAWTSVRAELCARVGALVSGSPLPNSRGWTDAMAAALCPPS